MGFSDYHFVTHWRVEGDREVVYEILKDGERYPEWWRPAYVSCRRVGKEAVTALVRAKLPYTLEFTSELVREKRPEEIEIRATGELHGRGLWSLRQSGSFTEVDFHWDVQARKPWVRALSFLLKPLFRWNHDWVMKTGEPCLQEEVSRKSIHAGSAANLCQH